MSEGKAPTKLASVGIPCICAVIALVSVYLQYNRLTTADRNIKDAENQIKLLDEDLKKSRGNEFASKVPSVPNTPEEDTQFLDGLKLSAQRTGVTILKWSSTSKPAGTDTPNQPQPVPLQGVTAILSDLEVQGPYESVRAFVINLESQPRLLNMNNLSWHRGTKEGTKLFVNLVRYVSQKSG